MTNLDLNELRLTQAARARIWGRAYLITIAVGMAVMLCRVTQLKLIPDSDLQAAVGSPISSRIEINRRGDLLDRAGRVIATSTVGYILFVDPQMVSDPNTIAIELADLTGRDPIEIDKTIHAHPDSRYIVLDRQLEGWQVEAVRKANLKGVGLDPRLVRQYPHVDLAAGVIGKVGFDHTGQAGFEHIFNGDMLPTVGKLTYLRDVRRKALWIDPNDYEPGRDGQDVRLSIDLVIQEFAEKRLRQAVDEYNAGGGRILAIDCRSGEILAMADFINSRKGSPQQINDTFRAIDPALGRNRCASDPYEPGSTFKPFIWAVATQLRKAKLDEVLPLPDGPWTTPYGRTIRDAHYYGPSTWRKVLIKSINAGMAMIAQRMTHAQMQDAIRRFGFGAKTNCGIPGETAGIVTSPKKWKTYTQSSVAMGHEIAVTPLQMVRAFSAFARDGTLPDLQITAAPLAPGSAGGPDEPPHPVIPLDIVLTARDAMKGVMEEGTGRAAQSQKYQMFGKSGTAQLPKSGGRRGGGYYQDRYVSSFIAAAPFTDPRIVVLCVLDDPDRRKGHFGGAIAGPVVRDIIDDTLTYLGVAPDQPVNDQVLANRR